MDKRYQVFVSSTYADLKEERQHVIQTLMEMDCIPAGMELFPAMDEEQWEFIKKVIDDCDYYLLVIGGRYGSTTAEGISYTEMEFDYAIEKGLKVVALVHEKPNMLPGEKIELDSELRNKLEQFRARVLTGRLVKFWRSAEELPGLVSLSLQKTIKTYPATGWVRGDQVASETLLSEINELRKENNLLKAELENTKLENTTAHIRNLVDFKSKFEVCVSFYETTRETKSLLLLHDVTFTWEELFLIIASLLFRVNGGGAHELRQTIEGYFLERFKKMPELQNRCNHCEFDEDRFEQIVLQFMAYGLIEKRREERVDSFSVFTVEEYILTKLGLNKYLESCAIKNEQL